MQASAAPSTSTDYDVVIIGGAVAGAASAILLKRWHPTARVLIVERTTEFNRKVGEATVEVSGLFFTKVLEVTQPLSRDHMPKHGLRFWFDDGTQRPLHRMGELGPSTLPTMASFHIDRAAFDEYLLHLAASEGADLVRPAQVNDVQLGWPQSRVTYTPMRIAGRVDSQGGGDAVDDADGSRAEPRCVSTHWVIDASGRNTFLARRLDLLHKPTSHPTAAVWARWTDVADLDSPAMLGPDPCMPRLPRLNAARGLSTNHFCGLGWWCWVIPLIGGQTSIGIVYDKRLFELPDGGKLRQRFEEFLRAQPGLRELLAQASMDHDDFFAYKDLPYVSRQYADPGWALVGDAAAFLDPLYSAGLDHMGFSTFATARLIVDDLAGRLCENKLALRLKKHNGDFARSYERWLQSIYVDKYELFGDPQLVSASYFIDIGMYYLGVVRSVHRKLDNFTEPPLGTAMARGRVAAALMTFIKGRMVRLARTRRKLGVVSKLTPAQDMMLRKYPRRFELGLPAVRLVLRGLRLWWGAELKTVMHRLLRPSRSPAAAAPTTSPSAAATAPAGEDASPHYAASHATAESD